MGTPKAWLDWHGTTLLRRACGIVARGTSGPVIVVRAPGQELPELPGGVRIVEDAREGRGPLQGILAGLEATDADVAFVASVDLPFLHPGFVAAVCAAVDGDTDVAVPFVGGYRQPLAAAYRTAIAPVVEELVAADRMKPAFLFERVRTRWLEALPHPESVRNLNEPADYEAARARPGPAVTVRRFGALSRIAPGGAAPAIVEAATLGEAAAGAGLTLDEHVVAALNGDQITRDPEVPLVAGDSVAFLAADAGG